MAVAEKSAVSCGLRPMRLECPSAEESPGDAGTSVVGLLWECLCAEARAAIDNDHVLARAMNLAVLDHDNFANALAHRIGQKLGNPDINHAELTSVVSEV